MTCDGECEQGQILALAEHVDLVYLCPDLRAILCFFFPFYYVKPV